MSIIIYLRRKKMFILSALMFVHGFVSFLVGDTTIMELAAGSSELVEMFTGSALAANRAAQMKKPTK